MLSELYIKNLAVISEAQVSIGSGFNVFTGETGAGKSILIHGINAVLGQRVTKDIVRTGADKAVISALFKEVPAEAAEKLSELGFSAEDGQLTLTREISADGGSVARVNSRSCTVNVLKEVGDALINIHGQHDSQSLLNPELHIGFLDSFGGLEALKEEYQLVFRSLQKTAGELKKLSMMEAEKAQRVAFLSDRIEDIAGADIEENEDVKIEEEYKIVKSAAELSETLMNIKALLSDEEDGAIVRLNAVSVELSSGEEVMAEFSELRERTESAQIELEDIFGEICRIEGKIDTDPRKLEKLTSRREELNRLKKLYGPELSDVLKTLDSSVEELKKLEASTDEILRLKEERQRLLEEATEKAKKLSFEREKAAKKLIERVTKELEFLDMPGVKLAVSQEKGKLTVKGMDSVEFLISANAGEPPKPIAKIASGGELSRIMLALKSVLAEQDRIPTLIFDEIDTGVSGRAAQKIGIKLAQLSRKRQVLCVTHLAQLAMMADSHMMIEKHIEDGRTKTQITVLDFEGRKRELARIIGGDNITGLTLENAEEMLLSKDKLLGAE